MFKHCYARVRAWFVKSSIKVPVAPQKAPLNPGPRVQMHMRKAARKAPNAG